MQDPILQDPILEDPTLSEYDDSIVDAELEALLLDGLGGDPIEATPEFWQRLYAETELRIQEHERLQKAA
jgi:hypothetical protein